MPGPFGALCHVNLLHNNEVRNVTNQNTRQHRDKVLRFLLSSFYHYNILYLGQKRSQFLVYLSAATELKRLLFYCRGRVSIVLKCLEGERVKILGRGGRFPSMVGKKYEGNWSRTAGSNIQQIRYNNISYIISYLIDLVAALERLLHVIPEMAI